MPQPADVAIPVLTAEQPTPALIAAGAQTIVTAKAPTSYRGEVAIYAKRRLPDSCKPRLLEGEGWSEPVGGWRVLWEKRTLRGRTLMERLSLVRLPIPHRHPILTGVIVATAQLVHVVPTDDLPGTGMFLTVWDGKTFCDYGWNVADQRPFADFSSGRYALLLARVTPLVTPVKFKGGPSLTRYWTPPASGPTVQSGVDVAPSAG